MPLHALRKAIRAVPFTAVLFYSLFVSIEPLSAEEQPGTVLPTMIVFASKHSDNTVTQRSEVAWHDANDSTIIRERDGTYTANSITNSYSLKSLLVSLGSPTVNIDFSYAINSASMNADGNLTLSTLIDAFKYLDEEVVLQVTPTLAKSGQLSTKLMQRRLGVLREMLARSTRVKFRVMPAKIVADSEIVDRASHVWRIQVRRAGGQS